MPSGVYCVIVYMEGERLSWASDRASDIDWVEVLRLYLCYTAEFKS